MSYGSLVTGTIRLPQELSGDTNPVSSLLDSIAEDLELPRAFRHISQATDDGHHFVTGSIRVPHGKEDAAVEAITNGFDELAVSFDIEDTFRRVIVSGRANSNEVIEEKPLTAEEEKALTCSRTAIVRGRPHPGFGIKF